MQPSIMKLQTELSDLEKEISTGRLADVGLSLGAQTGQSISLRQQENYLQTLSNTNSSVSTRLDTTQTILNSVQKTAQTFLQSLISSGGNSTTASALQQAASANLKSLTANLNSTLDGYYLFAGQNSAVAPITDYYGSSAANKASVDAAFQSAFGMSQSSIGVPGISGTAMQSFLDTQFGQLFQGSNWNSDWSSATSQTITSQISPSDTVNSSVSANDVAFQKLAQAYTMVADLGTQNLSQDAYQAVVTTAESTIKDALSSLTDVQANVGSVQSRISTADDQMSIEMNFLTTQIGNLEDVDTYQATIRVTSLQTQIQTAYSLTSQLKQLSLVQYL
jgi:flagellar hook-associated protein 3 FlgL